MTLVLALLGLLGFACGGAAGGNSAVAGSGTGGDSPTDAYKRLYAAVKSKNTDSIKQMMSKETQSFAIAVAERQKKTIEQVYENGFTATTFSESLPEIRDERVDGVNGAVEVWNSKDSKWEDLPFLKEDSGWKLAVGDLFKNTWKSPGKGRAIRDQEAANAAGTGGPQASTAINANINSNLNTAVIVPKNSAK
ncbi:MAG TPA: hypothetical protein VK468_10190 [Pyrinomonadaceae bacterium]|nr:hypothetical protein [Pyrinomonadaceae bacterium]